MSDSQSENPGEEFERLIREFLSGQGEINPMALAGLAGLPRDPVSLSHMLNQLRSAIDRNADGIDWKLAHEQASQVAEQSRTPSTPAERSSLEQALHIGGLWLDEATAISAPAVTPRLMSRTEWVNHTMPVWSSLAEPVANNIAKAVTAELGSHLPEEMSGMLEGASSLMRGMGGALFAMQLGQVVGGLSKEVVSGGDIGIPLLSADQSGGVLVPQNVAAFGDGLDLGSDQVALYLSVRELAHARLFRHAKWLGLQLISSISSYAGEIRIDTDGLESVVADLDPTNPEGLRQALAQGAFIPAPTEQQRAVLARLETTLALIEGWVDVVTQDATNRLPGADAVAETVRRRRAVGGPAESAFSTLVGLELRPRRLREAAALWRLITDEIDIEERDALWSHPDLVPTAEDIDDPEGFITKLRNGPTEPDAIDLALQDLLKGDVAGGQHASGENEWPSGEEDSEGPAGSEDTRG